MVDPFYRTIDGLIVLIEKDWLSFGHMFQARTFGTLHDPNDRSPIFLLWLDCVSQCVRQRPQAFEFTERLLILLADHHQSGWFGNFIGNGAPCPPAAPAPHL